MSIALPILAVLLAGAFAAYLRLSLKWWVALTSVLLLLAPTLGGSVVASIVCAVLFAAVALPLLIEPVRHRYLATPLLRIYTRMLPQLSDTERTALEAGTVGFEGELFSGMPRWKQLLSQPKPELSVEEQAFLDGPV
ncbi:MAG: acyl-CoA dehydrogenase, partial [Gammaproteobacteria bacterium HGW-Gammaproteobacteria-7]